MLNVKGNNYTELKVDKGILENGISYYIIDTARQKKIIDLFLVVDVGAKNELAHQKGSAHYLEHMLLAFDKYSTEYGAVFGYTNFDETLFNIESNNNYQDLYKTAQMLCRIANGDNLTRKLMESVRGDIVKEWDFQIRQKYFNERNIIFPLVMQDFNAEEDMPIGKLELIENVKFQEIEQFHMEHYDVKKTNIIAMGSVKDVDIVDILQRTLGQLETIDGKPTSKKNNRYIYANKNYLVHLNDNNQKAEVNVYIFRQVKKQSKLLYKEDIIDELAVGVLMQAIQRQLQKTKCNVKNIITNRAWLMKNSKIYSISIELQTATNVCYIAQQIKYILESYRVKKFSLHERRQFKRELLSYIDEEWMKVMLDKCISECIFDEAMIETPNYLHFVKKVIDKISLSEVAWLVESLLSESYIYIYCNDSNYVRKKIDVIEF